MFPVVSTQCPKSFPTLSIQIYFFSTFTAACNVNVPECLEYWPICNKTYPSTLIRLRASLLPLLTISQPTQHHLARHSTLSDVQQIFQPNYNLHYQLQYQYLRWFQPLRDLQPNIYTQWILSQVFPSLRIRCASKLCNWAICNKAIYSWLQSGTYFIPEDGVHDFLALLRKFGVSSLNICWVSATIPNQRPLLLKKL